MITHRTYGRPPITITLAHGGPGSGGEMGPVARTLAATGYGVLEALQTADSLPGQIDELARTMRAHADPPLILIGFSWGAWLSILTAVRHPDLVRKLILISSGPFEQQYTAGIMQTRLGRLNTAEQEEVASLYEALASASGAQREVAFARFGSLFAKTDAVDAIKEDEPTANPPSFRIYNNVWPQAAELRRSGELLAQAAQIHCPVTAIHGADDPHPAAGVRDPLATVIPDFQFILLDQCGHMPWVERAARDGFYKALRTQLAADI